MEKRKLGYISLYAFIYVSIGALGPFIGQHLKAIGFSGTRIGVVTAGGTAVSILTAAFWGHRYSASKDKKRFFLKLCVCAALVSATLFFVKGFWLFLLIFCALYFFQAPILAFIDAMVMEDGQPFGAARMWGAIGFACGVFLVGRAVGLLGLPPIFFFYAAGFFICAVILAGMIQKEKKAGAAADGKEAAAPKEEPRSKRALLSNRTYLELLVCAFFLCGTNVANNVYFGFLFTRGGGSVAGIGLAFMLMGGSEAPFMAWSAKLAERFTLEKTLLASMCVSVLRFAWYSTCPSSSLLLLFFFLQGMVNGFLLVEFVRYIAKAAGAKQLGLAVSVYYGSVNLSAILCQLLGGVILDFFGIGGVYLFFAGMNAAGVIVYVTRKLYRAAG